MNDKEAVDMMNRAEQEIQDLRSQLAYHTPRSEAYGVLSAVVGMTPQGNQTKGYAEDFLYILRRERQKIQESLSLSKAAATADNATQNN